MNRHERVTERPFPLPVADDQIGAAGDEVGTGMLGEKREGLLDGTGLEVPAPRHYASTPADRRPHPLRGHRQPVDGRADHLSDARSRSAAAVATHGGSPTPFEPFGPAFGVSVSTHAISICGASADVTSL